MSSQLLPALLVLGVLLGGSVGRQASKECVTDTTDGENRLEGAGKRCKWRKILDRHIGTRMDLHHQGVEWKLKTRGGENANHLTHDATAECKPNIRFSDDLLLGNTGFSRLDYRTRTRHLAGMHKATSSVSGSEYKREKRSLTDVEGKNVNQTHVSGVQNTTLMSTSPSTTVPKHEREALTSTALVPISTFHRETNTMAIPDFQTTNSDGIVTLNQDENGSAATGITSTYRQANKEADGSLNVEGNKLLMTTPLNAISGITKKRQEKNYYLTDPNMFGRQENGGKSLQMSPATLPPIHIPVAVPPSSTEKHNFQTKPSGLGFFPITEHAANTTSVVGETVRLNLKTITNSTLPTELSTEIKTNESSRVQATSTSVIPSEEVSYSMRATTESSDNLLPPSATLVYSLAPSKSDSLLSPTVPSSDPKRTSSTVAISSSTVATGSQPPIPISSDLIDTNTIRLKNWIAPWSSTIGPVSISTMSPRLTTDVTPLSSLSGSARETQTYASVSSNSESFTDVIKLHNSLPIHYYSTPMRTDRISHSSSTQISTASNFIQQPSTLRISPHHIPLTTSTATDRERIPSTTPTSTFATPMMRTTVELIRDAQPASPIPMHLEESTAEPCIALPSSKLVQFTEPTVAVPSQLATTPQSSDRSVTGASNKSVPTPVQHVDASPYHDNASVATREALLALFKRRYPVQLWRTNGYFTDGFFHLVDDLWLAHEPPSPGAHYALAACYCLIMVVGVFGNSLVIYMFIRCRSLRTPANILVWNLAVSDLFLLLNLALFIFNSANLGPALGEMGCQVYGFVGALTGTVSIMTLALIAVDRYNVIVYPLEPLRKTSSKSARALVVGVWCYGALFSVLPLCGVGIRPYVPEGYLTSCTFDYLVQDDINFIYIISFFFAAWVLPLATICFCYVGICHAVLRTRKVAQSAESHRHCREEEKRSSELRLAGVVIVIVGLWFVSWTPYAVVSLLGITGQHHLITPLSSMAPAVFCKTASCIDPFVYAVTHPRFRKELLALTGLRMERNMQRGYPHRAPESGPRRTSESSVQEELVMVDIRDGNSSCSSSPETNSQRTGKKSLRRSSQRITWTPDKPYLPFTDTVRKQLQPPSWFVPPKPHTDRSTSLRLKDRQPTSM